MASQSGGGAKVWKLQNSGRKSHEMRGEARANVDGPDLATWEQYDHLSSGGEYIKYMYIYMVGKLRSIPTNFKSNSKPN